MKLSAKARRFIAQTARGLPSDAGRERLRIWMELRAGEDLPADIANITLELMSQCEQSMRRRLDTDLEEDQRAALVADLRIVYAVKHELKQ
jgi:hypothetical protein